MLAGRTRIRAGGGCTPDCYSVRVYRCSTGSTNGPDDTKNCGCENKTFHGFPFEAFRRCGNATAAPTAKAASAIRNRKLCRPAERSKNGTLRTVNDARMETAFTYIVRSIAGISIDIGRWGSSARLAVFSPAGRREAGASDSCRSPRAHAIRSQNNSPRSGGRGSRAMHRRK